MEHPQINQRVKIVDNYDILPLAGMLGNIRNIDINQCIVELDVPNEYTHDCDGYLKYENGWYVSKYELQLVIKEKGGKYEWFKKIKQNIFNKRKG